VDWLPQAVGAALDEPTESRREWVGKRKAAKARRSARKESSSYDHTPITRTSRRSDTAFLTEDVPICVPMGLGLAVLSSSW